MLRLKPIRKPFSQAGALHNSVNLFGFWNENAFITKFGDVGVVLKVNGIDYESMDHAARDLAVKRLEAALRVFDEKTRIYQILFKNHAEVISPAAHPNPLVQSAIELRQRHLSEHSCDLYRLDSYFVLLREGANATTSALGAFKQLPHDFVGSIRDFIRSFASEKTRILVADQIESISRHFEHRVQSFTKQLEDLVLIELLSSQEAYSLTRKRAESGYKKCRTSIEMSPISPQ